MTIKIVILIIIRRNLITVISLVLNWSNTRNQLQYTNVYWQNLTIHNVCYTPMEQKANKILYFLHIYLQDIYLIHKIL